MSYSPYIPSSGVAGWNFLQTSYDRQFDTFTKTAEIKNDTEYFLENIKNVKTSEDLLDDRRLLKVAVKAFGLEEEINYRALLQRALNEGTQAPDALANTMDDERYVEFSNAFGFGPGQSLLTTDSKAMKALTDTYKRAEFEVAVGETDDTMRTALFAKRALVEIFGESDDSANRSEKEKALDDFNKTLDAINGSDDDDGYKTVDEKWEDIFKQDALMEFFDTALKVTPAMTVQPTEDKIKTYRQLSEKIFGSDDPTVFFAEENRSSTTIKYRVAASSEGLSTEDIARTLALTEGIMDQMIAEEAELNEQWNKMMSNNYVGAFMTIALGLPEDIDTRPETEQMTIYRQKATDIVGSPDPKVFASESNIGDLIDIYKANARELGMSESEIQGEVDIVSKILELQVGDVASDTSTIEANAAKAAADEERRIKANWYSVLGQNSMESVVKVTLDVPDDFNDLDLDAQVEVLRTLSKEAFGTDDPAEFSGEYMIDGFVDTYREKAETSGESQSMIDFFAKVADRELKQLFQVDKVDSDKELEDILDSLKSDDEDEKEDDSTITGKWFTIMGQQALTDFMRTALGLPEAVEQLDVDDSVEIYKRKAKEVMGSENPSDFVTEDNMEKLINLYLTRTQLESGNTSNNYALMLLG